MLSLCCHELIMELYFISCDYYLRQDGKFCALLISALIKYISLAITLNVATDKLLSNDYDVCIVRTIVKTTFQYVKFY